MQQRSDLRGAVYSRFTSIAAMADAIGWTRQKATRIVNGDQEPTLDDVDKLSKAMRMPFEDTARYFLPEKSQI